MDLDSIETSHEEARQYFFEQVSNGAIALDGVMSPLTRQLVDHWGTEGVDMTFAWACTPMDWVCPACGRGKADIVRINTNGDLMCRLVEHHDHMKDLVKDEFERHCKKKETIVADEFAKRFAARASQMISAYDNAIICDDCNAADPKAKAAAGTHKDFSFSPPEIRRFVKPRPNLPHEIDAEEAARIWEENSETFSLRLRIATRIAAIAADNAHWYQELPYLHRAETVFQIARSIQSHYGVYGALHQLTGERRRPPAADVSAWRRVTHKRPRSGPLPEDIRYIAKISSERHWALVDDSWSCPSCKRTKVEVVRKSNKGTWGFLLSERNFYASGERYGSKRAVVCGECALLASNLGKEACLIAEADISSNYAQFLSVTEVALVVLPQPHSRHNVKNEAADELVMDLVERIKLFEEQCD